MHASLLLDIFVRWFDFSVTRMVTIDRIFGEACGQQDGGLIFIKPPSYKENLKLGA
jgi:hypothetical protein